LNEEPEQELDLHRIASVVFRRRWIIIGLVAIAAALALANSARIAPKYEATSTLRVSSPNAARLFENVQQYVDPKRLVDTETQVLMAHDLRAAVDEAMGSRASGIEAVTIRNPPGTDLLQVLVTSTSPELARDAANTYADLYLRNRQAENANDLGARAKELRSQAALVGQQIEDLPANDPQRVALQASQTSFLSLATQYDAEAGLVRTNVQIVDRAQQPTSPVAPRPLRDVAFAEVAALVLAVAIAFVLDHLDDRIMDPPKLEQVVKDVPVLASVPVYAPGRRRPSQKIPRAGRALVPPDSPEAEVYRTLRSNVRFSLIGRSLRILMVTSASAGEGKSTVTSNLAVSLAQSGQRVVLVSADLRQPSLGQFFGVEETRQGLTSVLLGDRTLEESLVPIPVEGGNHLHLLPSGPLPANPAEVLGSSLTGALLQQVAQRADFVLIDSPPVLPVSDPLALAQYADGVVLVALARRTRAHQLVDALGRLERVGSQIVGVVLNGVATGKEHYAYRYPARADGTVDLPVPRSADPAGARRRDEYGPSSLPGRPAPPPAPPHARPSAPAQAPR
jgi:succinoglycan biosynthesis transport protein ExoP